MADNTILNPGSGGDTIRTLDRTTSKTEVIGLDFGGDTGAGNEQLVTITNPLPVQPAATYFSADTNNSSTTQLPAGHTFTGTLTSTLNQQSLSLLITNDIAITLTINQYITTNTNSLASSWTYTLRAGEGFSQSMVINSNYYNLVVTNVDTSTSTNLNINSYLGTSFPSGPVPVSGATPVVFGSLQQTFSFTAVNQTVVITNAGFNTLGLQISSIGSGGTLSFAASIDGVNYDEVYGYLYDPDIGFNRLISSISQTTAKLMFIVGGMNYIQITASALTSGTIIGAVYGSSNPSSVNIAAIARTPQYPAAPTATTVGTSSASVVVANSSRTGLVLTNTSNGIISLGLGSAAVLNNGITLTPYGVFTMDQNTFTTDAINAIASTSGCNLAIQEYS